MNPDDTIAAVATPTGQGGLAVIRISGREALSVADRCFRPVGRRGGGLASTPERQVVLGHVLRGGTVVDEVMATVFRGPRSFTAEDTVELACHGGMLVTRLVLETVLAAGARPAGPGEFSLRAFLNGRIDLAQAEAVADLIHARTQLALEAAREQMAGTLSARIGHLRDDLMSVLAHVEAHIDFPDEDITPDTSAALLGRLDRALAEIGGLLGTAHEGRILRHGLRTAIVGLPNAGKSSLLNRLLGHDRAIVSPVAGTTRDTIEEQANVRGIPVVFVDTAGLRDSDDAVEREGIRRSRAAAATAELVLHVVDASEPASAAEDSLLAEFAGPSRIVVANKSDVMGSRRIQGSVFVSCRTGDGIDSLAEAIVQRAWSGAAGGGHDGVAINSRHQNALERARSALALTHDGLAAGLSPELVAFELRSAVGAVGEVVGKTTTEDLLDSIFSQFCIGK